VKIDLHHHLLQNRRNAAVENPSWWERFAFQMFAFTVNHPRLYRLAKQLGRVIQPLHGLVKGSRLDFARAWTQARDLPPLAPKSFKEQWQERT
jgi:L-lactate dehydrogenase complex protein LldF